MLHVDDEENEHVVREPRDSQPGLMRLGLLSNKFPHECKDFFSLSSK